MLSMSIGIIGGVVGCLFIGKKIHLSTMEYSASNGEWGALMMACFTMGYALCIPACPKHLHGFGRHCYPVNLGFVYLPAQLGCQKVRHPLAEQLHYG